MALTVDGWNESPYTWMSDRSHPWAPRNLAKSVAATSNLRATSVKIRLIRLDSQIVVGAQLVTGFCHV